MAKITAIKAQVKNPERVSVYVDEKYAFSLGYNQLLEQKLRVGLEIDDARVAELKKISDFGKAYERALNFAAIRPRSVREISDYAWRKKIATEDFEMILARLTKFGYVSDEKFARAWVQNRMLGNKTSLRKLRLELKQKGVSDSIIAQALEASEFSESAALRELVAKKRKLTRYANDDQKLARYLVGQGFTYDDIREALA